MLSMPLLRFVKPSRVQSLVGGTPVNVHGSCSSIRCLALSCQSVHCSTLQADRADFFIHTDLLTCSQCTFGAAIISVFNQGDEACTLR
jgi:hypothetical protein